MVVHFYRPTTRYCQVVDAHFERLAQRHLETRVRFAYVFMPVYMPVYWLIPN